MRFRCLRAVSVALLCAFFVTTFTGVGFVSMAQQEGLSVTYEFTGDEAEKAGFAQGEITITPGSDSLSEGYYLIYYADDTDTLKAYDELATVKITGYAVTHTVKDGTMIPTEATRLAVFENSTRILDETPSIADAAAVIDIPDDKRLTLGVPEMTFGTVSDVHMNYEVHDRGAYAKWAAALDFFAAKKTDYVIVTGDMTGDEGENSTTLAEQYQTYLDIINESDIALENVYECIGNHGNTPEGREIFVEYTSGAGEVHPYENSPYFSVLIEGKTESARDNLFIVMAQELEAPGDSAAYDNFSEEQIDWLESVLTQYGNTDTNIFILEHSPFLDFGAGDRVGGGYRALVTFKEEYTQTMRFKALLETYKDAIVMSGHTHVSLYDTENYSDEYNSFARTVHVGSTCQPCGYGEGSTYTRSYDGRYSVTPTYGSEAYLVDVYDEYIVYTGYNLSTGKIIPGACLLLPVNAYGGPGKPETSIPTPEEAFRGSGTAEDPYLITSAEDFKALTDGFNASVSTTESEMYGYGLYFEQTADIYMCGVKGYNGTTANGNAKAFFAGTYNGGGYTITVDIAGDVQRSVFPYVYGTICNTVIKGRIVSDASAQPVRTLYGNLINCVFDIELSAERANGALYSAYGHVYNVYTRGTVEGTYPDAVAPNVSSSATVANLYHCYSLPSGTAVTDTYGIRTEDLEVVVAAFADRSSTDYQAAQEKLGTVEMVDLSVLDGELVLTHPITLIGDADKNGVVNTTDVKCIIKHALGVDALSGQALTLADFNGDGAADSGDARAILKRIVNEY